MQQNEILEEIKIILDDQAESARLLYEDFQAQGLNFNAIEAEGYLRASIQIKFMIYELLNNI